MGKGKRAINTNVYEKDTNKRIKIIAIIVAIILVLLVLFYILTNYIVFDKNKEINLVINNNNITSNMESEVVIDEKGIIYLSESDTKRFFDKYIYEVNNKIVTTYDEKIAEIGFETNVMEVNDSRSRD